MNGENEIKEKAVTPYDLGVKSDIFRKKINEIMKKDINYNNFKENESEHMNIALNIDSTIQIIENEFLSIEKKIDNELAMAKRLQFTDTPFSRATDEYGKWVGMFKANTNLRNLMFELHLSERERLYDLLERTSIMDKEIAKLKAEKDVLNLRKSQDEKIISALDSLTAEQKNLSSGIKQTIQPALPEGLVESINKMTIALENQPKTQPEYPKPQVTSQLPPPPEQTQEKPSQLTSQSSQLSDVEIVKNCLSTIEKSEWKTKINHYDIKRELRNKHGLTDDRINEAWNKINEEMKNLEELNI